jgi:predicted RNase H-like nuclease (RuvC/YqgF family)
MSPESDVLDCGVAVLRDSEIARLNGIIEDLERKDHLLITESGRIGHLLQQSMTKSENFRKDISRRLEDIADLREVVARLQTERDDLARALAECQKKSA